MRFGQSESFDHIWRPKVHGGYTGLDKNDNPFAGVCAEVEARKWTWGSRGTWRRTIDGNWSRFAIEVLTCYSSSAEKAVNERLGQTPELYILALAQFAISADTDVVRSLHL